MNNTCNYKIKKKKHKGELKYAKAWKPWGCTHTHTHTGYIREINKKEQKKNIKLFSNMLFLHTQKVCEK